MAAYPSTLTDGSWQDRAFVSIIRKDDEETVDLHGLTDEMGWADGMRDFEGVPVANGGRVRQREAQDDSTFNATMWQVGAATEELSDIERPKGAEEYFYETGNITEGEGYTTYGNSLKRHDYILVILWTNDPNVESATDEVSGEYVAHRRIADNLNVIDAVPEWADQVLQLEWEGKWTPFDTQGVTNFFIQDFEGVEAEDSLPEVDVAYVDSLKDKAVESVE